MSKPKSPEAIKAEIRKNVKAELKRQMKMIKSVKETQDHDRKTCTCEGCHNYALMGTIMQNGRLFTVVPEWEDISPEEFWRSALQMLRYKEDKKTSAQVVQKKLIEKGVPEEQAKALVAQMLAPIHIIFYKPPPMGLMKEI